MPDEMPFWKRKTLAQMTPEEWESLCDGCGRCCLIKLEDEDTGEIVHTRVACELLNIGNCHCTDYQRRQEKIPDCVKLATHTVEELGWMPESCAYRLISNGEDLAWWHPLISGSLETVHEAGISIRDFAISETRVKDKAFEKYILKFI